MSETPIPPQHLAEDENKTETAQPTDVGPNTVDLGEGTTERTPDGASGSLANPSGTTNDDITTSSMGNAFQGQPNLDTDDPESEVYDGPETNIDKDYTYATYMDPQRQRDPNGIYLDDV